MWLHELAARSRHRIADDCRPTDGTKFIGAALSRSALYYASFGSAGGSHTVFTLQRLDLQTGIATGTELAETRDRDLYSAQTSGDWTWYAVAQPGPGARLAAIYRRSSSPSAIERTSPLVADTRHGTRTPRLGPDGVLLLIYRR